MEKTRVKAEFVIYGDDFDLNYVSNILKIEPNKSHNKGDIIRSNNPLRRKETTWMIETDYEECLDVEIVINKILDLLKEKKEELKQIRNKYSVEMLLMIVVIIEDGRVPVMWFSKKAIKFAAEIDAEIDFDVYCYSLEKEEDLYHD